MVASCPVFFSRVCLSFSVALPLWAVPPVGSWGSLVAVLSRFYLPWGGLGSRLWLPLSCPFSPLACLGPGSSLPLVCASLAGGLAWVVGRVAVLLGQQLSLSRFIASCVSRSGFYDGATSSFRGYCWSCGVSRSFSFLCVAFAACCRRGTNSPGPLKFCSRGLGLVDRLNL